MTSVLNTLGVGSGVDTTALIDALVAAEQVPRANALTARSTRVDARVSGLAQVSSGLSALVTALAARTRGGALGPLPASSNSVIAAASATKGATPLMSPSEIEIKALAGGQTLISPSLASASSPVGKGVLTLRLGTMTPDGQGGFGFAGNGNASVEVTINANNDSLTGLRDAINAAQAVTATPIQASIVADGGGARLVLKGAGGSAGAFIVTADPADGGTGLDRFRHNPAGSTMTTAAAARDASLVIDGVAVTRPSNHISDLIDGVTLDLRAAAPGTIVTIAATRDADGLKSATRDLVSALNVLNTLTTGLIKPAGEGDVAGVLAGDSMMRTARSALTGMTALAVIAGVGGSPTRLTDLGIATARDGSLTIDEARLGTAIAAAPDAVEKILAALTGPTGPLTRIGTDLAGSTAAGTISRYAREQASIARDRTALDTRMTSYRATLVKQYGVMEGAVAAAKSTQSFLDAQIKAWNRTDN